MCIRDRNTNNIFYEGESIIPMKTAAVPIDPLIYGWFHNPSNMFRDMDVGEYNANTSQYVTGIQIRWADAAAYNASLRAPTSGRVTLLRMKYS